MCALYIKLTRSIWQRFGLRLTFPIVRNGTDPTVPTSDATSVSLTPLAPLTPVRSSWNNLGRRFLTFKANMLVKLVLSK